MRRPVRRLHRLRRLLVGAALATHLLAATGEARTRDTDAATGALATQLRDRLTNPAPPLRTPGDEVHALARLYTPGNFEPRWLDRAGRPTAQSTQALQMLGQAAAEGLDPADYDVEGLATLSRSPAPAYNALEFELRLSASLLRYLTHLHAGRVDPRRLSYPLPAHPADDIVPRLHAALAAGTLARTAAELTPQLPQYRLLRSALARHRARAADPAGAQTPRFDRVLRPGDAHPSLGSLQAWLMAEDDLAATAMPASTYDPATVAAVQRFQRRHGLQADGVIGAATQAALNVTPAQRARQIVLAMERLRWLPPLNDRPLVAINIPMFRLWAAAPSMPEPAPPLDMAVVVGRALNTRTPVLMKPMERVIFRPWWNVPRSIVRNEILPALRRDPRHLERHDMEIVRGPGDDAQAVAATGDNVALLAQGVLRLRQRPGARNSLGLVKFVFPNDDNVYLHGTPAQQLFERSRRDFSHGCVRVEDPVALAEWVLSAVPGWDRARIVAAMQATRTSQVNLPQPLRVVLFYVTAAVMPADGALHFADDIYGHDRRLEAALAQRAASR